MSLDEIRYTETHEWARLDEEDVVVVGLSEFAVDQLGDIVYLELPAEGEEVTKGDSFGVIESVKAASDLYAPVSGEVVEANEDVSESLDLFKTDPTDKAWLIKIRMSDPEEFESLMTETEYESFSSSEGDVDEEYEDEED